MPVRVLITEGTRADCKEAVHLIEGISAETLLADRGYDTNEILAYAISAGMEPVIPPKKNRKEQRDYDKNKAAAEAPACQIVYSKVQVRSPESGAGFPSRVARYSFTLP